MFYFEPVISFHPNPLPWHSYFIIALTICLNSVLENSRYAKRTKDSISVETSYHQAVEHMFVVEVSTCLTLDTILGASGCDRRASMKVISVNFCRICLFRVEISLRLSVAGLCNVDTWNYRWMRNLKNKGCCRDAMKTISPALTCKNWGNQRETSLGSPITWPTFYTETSRRRKKKNTAMLTSPVI